MGALLLWTHWKWVTVANFPPLLSKLLELKIRSFIEIFHIKLEFKKYWWMSKVLNNSPLHTLNGSSDSLVFNDIKDGREYDKSRESIDQKTMLNHLKNIETKHRNLCHHIVTFIGFNYVNFFVSFFHFLNETLYVSKIHGLHTDTK